MAANQERTLKVSFEGDATDLSEVIQVVQNNFDGLDTTIKSVSTALGEMPKEGSEELRQMVATVEIVAKSLEHLEDLKGRALSGFTPLSPDKVYKTGLPTIRSDEDALARREAADQAKADRAAQKEADETAKKAAALRAEHAIALKEQSKENVRTFYEEIKSREVIAQNGANSLIAIKQREKDALLAAEREYNAKVMAYADRIAEGTRTEKQAQADMRKSEAAFERKVRSIKAEAATEIEIEKKKQDEIARLVKEQKATLAIATARQATDPQRMALIRAEVEEERAIQTRGFNDAYARQLEYNRKRLQAEQALQQELAGIKTSQAFGKFTPEEAFTKSTAALATYKKALQDLPSLNKHVQEHQNLIVKVAELIGVYRVLSTVWNTATNALRAIPKIGIELEATTASLSSTLEGAAGVQDVLKALNSEAARTGLRIEALRESFRNFQASTSLAGESLQSTWKMFTNINTVASALHLSTDQTNSVFLALAQIFNKTKVQSEELVKQLGNLLPGAFASFAAANTHLFSGTQDLVKKMKDGVVTAHATVENFTNFLATRFADAAAIAAGGLNANIGRMQTSFTLLGEAIYKETRGSMNAFVTSVTGMANSIRTAIDSGSLWIQVFKESLPVAIGLTGSALILLVEKMKLLEGAMSLFSKPMAIITGITAIISKLGDLKDTATGTRDAVLSIYEAAQQPINLPSASLYEKAERDPAVVAVRDAIATQKKIIKERTDLIATLKEMSLGSIEQKLESAFGVNFAEDAERKLKYDTKILIDLQEKEEKARETALIGLRTELAGKSAEQFDALAKKRRDLEITALESSGEKVLAAQARFNDKYLQEYNAAKERIAKAKAFPVESAEEKSAIKVDPKDAAFIKFYETSYVNLGKNLKDNLNEGTKVVNSAIRVNNLEIQGAANDTQAALKHIDASYKNFEISISEYMSRKRQALEAGLAAELKEIEQNKQLAISLGDTNKAREYDVRAKELQNKFANERNALLDDENTKTRELTTSLDALNDRVLKLRGAQVTDKATEELQARINREIAAGNTNPALRQGLQNIETEKYLIQLKKDSANAQASTADEYQAKLNRINILRQNGLLGELSATQQLAKLDEEHIALREKAVQVMQKEADEMVASGDKDAALIKIKRYKEETENLKITAASVGRLFEEKIGASFERTFTGLVNGTIQAKDAFKSFAASVVSDIISIAAQEARSAILQPLLKAGFSALGGMLGGMFGGGAGAASVAAGNSAGFASSFGAGSGASWMTAKLATGGVMSGPGISAYSSSIVDKPTIFPFASGTGLMGEAGPEAIMPLQRINGKLGVRAEVAQGQSQTIVHSPVFNIEMAKNDDPEGVGMKLAEGYIRGIARQEIVNSARIGGKTGQKLAT